MKVLFIVFNIVGRGTYLRAYELARALTKLGHQMTIIASSEQIWQKTKIIDKDEIRIIEVSDIISGPTRSGWDIGNVMARVNTVKQLDFDLVHGFESRPTVIYPAITLHKKGVPLFLDWADWFGRGGSVEERPNPLVRTLLRPFETYHETHYRKMPLGTTVICKTLAERAINLGVPEEDICLLPNGFNVEDWHPISIQQARSVLKLEQNQFLVGYLGSFFPKDADLVVGTSNHLVDQDQQIKLLHVGLSNYQIKHHVKHPDQIIETGPVSFSEMQTYLSACDVLLLPFNNTPANQGRFPLKFSHYLSCGRPIVATHVGDIPEYIEREKLGIITEDCPEAIVKAILHLRQNPRLRSEFGQSARNLSQDPQESWLNRAEKLLGFYSTQLEGKP